MKTLDDIAENSGWLLQQKYEALKQTEGNQMNSKNYGYSSRPVSSICVCFSMRKPCFIRSEQQ